MPLPDDYQKLLALVAALGVSLNEILTANVEKLKQGYPEGCSDGVKETDLDPLELVLKAHRVALAAPELLAALKLAYQYAPRHWQSCEGYLVGDDLTIFDDRDGCTCYIGQMMKAIEQADPSATETKRAT